MPPPPPPAPPPAPMAPPGPSKKSCGKSGSSAPEDRGALLSSIQHGARLKKTVTNDRSSPLVGGNKPPPANKFNTVAARPTSSGDRNLPSAWRGSRDDANTGGVQPPAGPMGLGGLFGGGIPTLPKNRGNQQRTGLKPSGSSPAWRSPGMSNGPVSVGKNNVSNNHMVNGPDIKGRPGPPPPPPSTTKPKLDFSNNCVNRNGHVSNDGIHDSISDRIGGLNRNSQDFAAGIPRGNPPPPPPNRQPPAVKPLKNSSTVHSDTNFPNNRPPSMSMVGRPLPPPPVQVPHPPQPPSSRPPSVGMSQPPAIKPPPPPVRTQPPPPVQISSNIRSGHSPAPPAPPQRTTSNMPGGTIGRSGRMPPPPLRSQMTGISGPPTHVPPPPPARKSGNFLGGYDDFEGKFKYHGMNELPPPEPFGNINKTFPTQAKKNQSSRRAPPPPPPP